MKMVQKQQNNNMGCGKKVMDNSGRKDGIIFVCCAPTAWGDSPWCEECKRKIFKLQNLKKEVKNGKKS